MENSLVEFVRKAHSIVQKYVDRYTSKYSKKTYTQPQLVVLNLLKVREDWTYRDVEEKLETMDTLQDELGLSEVPDHSTLQKVWERYGCLTWRSFLKETSKLIPSSQKMAVDATGFQRRWASRYYTQRTKMSLSALKVTIRADVGDPLVIRDVHMTTTRKHDSQILPELIPEDESGSFLAADKGYDHYDLRDWCRRQGIRPLIKHREFGPQDIAANARMKDDDYNHRQKVESIFSSVKRRYGDEATSRIWYRQFRDILAKMVAYNLDQIVQYICCFYEFFSWNPSVQKNDFLEDFDRAKYRSKDDFNIVS